MTIENGLVNVKPFTVNYKDIAIEIAGSHGFDKSLNYKAVLNVPAKYLGSEVNQLIGKIKRMSNRKWLALDLIKHAHFSLLVKSFCAG